MGLKVGDTIFMQDASPATVVEHNTKTSMVQYDKDFKAFQVNTRNGMINGMSEESRKQFDEIVDEVRSHKSNDDRVELLRNKIEELKMDPRNFRLVQYLDGEVRHLMSVKGVNPRFFKTEDFKVR